MTRVNPRMVNTTNNTNIQVSRLARDQAAYPQGMPSSSNVLCFQPCNVVQSSGPIDINQETIKPHNILHASSTCVSRDVRNASGEYIGSIPSNVDFRGTFSYNTTPVNKYAAQIAILNSNPYPYNHSAQPRVVQRPTPSNIPHVNQPQAAKSILPKVQQLASNIPVNVQTDQQKIKIKTVAIISHNVNGVVEEHVQVPDNDESYILCKKNEKHQCTYTISTDADAGQSGVKKTTNNVRK